MSRMDSREKLEGVDVGERGIQEITPEIGLLAFVKPESPAEIREGR